MKYRIDMDAEILPLVRKLHPEQKKKIKESLRAIAANPILGKPLQNKLVGLHSYRVGAWRIIYVVNQKEHIVHVVSIGPRSHIYHDLESKR